MSFSQEEMRRFRIDPLYDSESTEAQRETEDECQPYFVDLSGLPADQLLHLRQTGLLPSSGLQIQLLREKHVNYLSQVWERSLKAPFVSLDASRPWILYWCLHGCDLLDHVPEDEMRCRMVSTLEACWSSFVVTDFPVKRDEDALYYSDTKPDLEPAIAITAGAFGGGPAQLPHAATTYAAVLSLCILLTQGGIAGERARTLLARIRIPLYRWMLGLLDGDSGAYRMHNDGEIDIRASYTIICCASLLQIATPTLCQEKVVRFIARCQTFEGGLGGEPWSEAHGGYAYCGLAALQILRRIEILDLEALQGWLSRRQMAYEGGFSGRSNKLVDGCYSFWQGGAVAIASAASETIKDNDPWLEVGEKSDNRFLMLDRSMLERYILLCAQDIQGGLRDKPSKGRDFYHTCYNLSGLSVAENWESSDNGSESVNPSRPRLAKTHPCFNLRLERVRKMLHLNW